VGLPVDMPSGGIQVGSRSVRDAVWVIDYDVVTTFSRSRRHRHYDSVAGPVIFEPLFLILIVSELEPVAPALLIPVRLDQAPTFQAIADRQWLTVADSARGQPDFQIVQFASGIYFQL
jgi:hypothetical protein